MSRIVADRNRSPKLVFLVRRTDAERYQQERNYSLACGHHHRDVRDGNLQIENRDNRSICVLCDHTFFAIVSGNCNPATHAKALTIELLHNIDQIIHLMAKFEPARDPASVEGPMHR